MQSKRSSLVSCMITGAVLALSTMSHPAHAEPFATNKDVLDTCSSPKSSEQYTLCLGYIQGLLQRDELLRWTHPNLAYTCELPKGVGLDQIRAVVVKHLKDRPEGWHWTGAGTALYAIKRAFCEPSK